MKKKSTKGVMDGVPLTQEGVCQVSYFKQRSDIFNDWIAFLDSEHYCDNAVFGLGVSDHWVPGPQPQYCLWRHLQETIFKAFHFLQRRTEHVGN